jgi:hypothetical protein
MANLDPFAMNLKTLANLLKSLLIPPLWWAASVPLKVFDHSPPTMLKGSGQKLGNEGSGGGAEGEREKN